MTGRHRKPRHLDYFTCPACTTRIVIDLDALEKAPGMGFCALFGVEPDLDWLPKELLAPAEELVEQHEARHLAEVAA